MDKAVDLRRKKDVCDEFQILKWKFVLIYSHIIDVLLKDGKYLLKKIYLVLLDAIIISTIL